MPVGTNAYKGLALPSYGEFEQVGQSTANDQVTWTQKGGASGDLMVWRSSAGTEYMSIDSGGDLILEGSLAGGGGRVTWDGSANTMIFRQSTAANFARFRLPVLTTDPTTGMVKGDIVLAQASVSATALKLGCCISTATQLVQYTRLFDLAFGSET